jgi:hypothetical protein
MTVIVISGAVVDTPTALTDRVRVSAPDLTLATRQTYGPFAFDPIVSGTGGTRLPQSGDRALVGLDSSSGDSWLIAWHRDDTTEPPYDEEGGGGAFAFFNA